MPRAYFYGWVVVAVMAIVMLVMACVRSESVGDCAAAFVAAGRIAIVAGFAALAISRKEPDAEVPVVVSAPA